MILRSGVICVLRQADGKAFTLPEVVDGVCRLFHFDDPYNQSAQREYLNDAVSAESHSFNNANKALRFVLSYRILRDLQDKGFYNCPSLERLGLLRIGYADLNRLVSDDTVFAGDPVLSKLSVNNRSELLSAFLNEVRRRLCVDSVYFSPKDLIGRVYEYFLQAFSINADKEEGEFYTPHSIVELICELIEPYDGTIYDPCCGSGGMFVQASKFVEAHGGNTKAVQVYGQESQPETYRLAKMNLAVRGISYNLGSTAASTFTNDLHKTLKASYIMANPPFNLKKWRSENELLTDVRWAGYGVPPVSNANYAWILHMLSKLNVVNGVAGFLLANGALGDSDTYDIRRKLIENDKVEAIIVLPREMFYSTDISVTLWILNQNKKGGLYHKRQLRNRKGEILFVDLRTWNQNIYEKKYVQFLPEQIKRVAEIYHTWQSEGTDSTAYAAPELYRSVSLKEIEDNDFSLVPSRYIEFVDRDKDIDYERIMSDTASVVANLLKRQTANQEALKHAFKELGYEF